MASRNAPCVTTLKQVAASPSEGEGGGGKALEGSLGVGEPARPSNPDPVPDPV